MLIECASCEALVDAKEHGSVSHFDPERDPAPEETFLLSCPVCGDPILVGKELYGVHGEGENQRQIWSEPYRKYPAPRRSLAALIPSDIRSAFDEAVRCYKARSYVAAVIMCRKTLEGVCDQQGAKARNLAGAIKQLHEAGTIDDRLFAWSDALRLTGNVAAHGVGSVLSSEDANDVLDFTEAIVEYIYVLRKRFDEFQLRNSKRAGE